MGTNDKKVKSLANNKEFDPAEALIEIRAQLKEFRNSQQYRGGFDSLITQKMAIFNLLMNGLPHLFERAASGVEMGDELVAIQESWWELEKLIDGNRELHSKIWDLSSHG